MCRALVEVRRKEATKRLGGWRARQLIHPLNDLVHKLGQYLGVAKGVLGSQRRHSMDRLGNSCPRLGCERQEPAPCYD